MNAPDDKRMAALRLLYRQLKQAKIALSNAEQRQNNQKERDKLAKKIDTIDWIIEAVWNAKEG